VVVLCVSLGVDLPQQETELFPGSNFEGEWKVGAGTPTVQHVHCLFPADGLPQLIHKLVPDAVRVSVPQRCHVGMNRYDRFAQFGGGDGARDGRQRRVHQPRVKRAGRRQPVDLSNPKLAPIFLNKFQRLRQTALASSVCLLTFLLQLRPG